MGYNYEAENVLPQPLGRLLISEGIGIFPLAPGVTKPPELIDASIFLFRHIPNDQDLRWQIARELVEVREEVPFKPLNLENALLATYLSDDPLDQSWRNGYSSYLSEPNLRQLCRAIVNLRHYPWLRKNFEQARKGIPEKVGLALVRTNRIGLGTDGLGVTGCPEAVYQLQLHCGGKYMARVGFNLHEKDGQIIVSVVNLQGVPVGKSLRDLVASQCGLSPFNFLLRKLRLVVPEAEIKGLRNPRFQGAAPLYNACFKTEGIPRKYFFRERHEINGLVGVEE